MNNLVQQVKMSMAYGDLWVEITADGVSYAPDAVDDMVQQMGKAFSCAIAELRAHGVIRIYGEDEVDELEEEDIEVELEEEE
jgi:hypothetical protein